VKRPKFVTLLSQKVPIYKTERIEWKPDDGSKTEVYYGLFQPDGPSIHIAIGMGPEKQRQTFVHENLHLMLEVAGLADAYDSDEKLVTRLAPVLLSWIRENPAAMAYLQEQR
jgi:hypothetical protein